MSDRASIALKLAGMQGAEPEPGMSEEEVKALKDIEAEERRAMQTQSPLER